MKKLKTKNGTNNLIIYNHIILSRSSWY